MHYDRALFHVNPIHSVAFFKHYINLFTVAVCNTRSVVAVWASVAVVVLCEHSRVGLYITVHGFWNLSYPMGMPLVGSWRSAAGETNKDDNSPLLHTPSHATALFLCSLLCLSLFYLTPHLTYSCLLSLINSCLSTFCFSSMPLSTLAVEIVGWTTARQSAL